MLNLYTYTPVVTKIIEEEKFSDGEKMAVLYHNLFDYPLSFAELIKWQEGKSITGITGITSKNGFYFLEGRESLIYQRLLRKRISTKKLEIALNATRLLKIIPTIKMIAVTGSLAMGNSTDESDIDLMIITSKNTLWITRLCVYCMLYAIRYKLRRPRVKNERDALCLNMWLDESDLVFRSRNLYTAHEIAQIVPLVNKNKTYEKFLWKNKWILNWWPNSVRIRNPKPEIRKVSSFALRASNFIAFRMQYFYMKSKITREVVTSTRALFHPQDWGKMVLDRLSIAL